MSLAHSPALSLPDLRASLASRFEVVDEDISVADATFTLLRVRDTNTLVDALRPEEFAVDERLPYWADIWTSSLELARYCLTEANLRGTRALELGCGLGLGGIAAATAGANVTFSDYEQDALDFARYNAARNLAPDAFAREVQFLQLDWRSLPDIEPFDCIIAADVVYERRNFFPLVDAFARLLKPGGHVVLTEPGRTIGDRFLQMLREEGFGLNLTHHTVERGGKRSDVRRVIIRPLFG
ncbi:MAG: methyltransferase domain-containing protein [Ignavibacteriae bacterium]|nr:methyltransferase domain-containing protein [Ignavibacteriota bacterium]